MRESKLFTIGFSVFFWIFSFTFMLLLSIATRIALIFTHYRNVHFKIPAPGFATIARLATLGQLKITYEDGFDPKRQTVFCMNHTSLLDAFVASAAIPTPFCGLMNAWQAHIPFYGWLMRWSRGILVDSNKGETLKQISDGARIRKKEEMSILVFPEAHRTLDGKVRVFRRGAFFMARGAGYPVAPLAVRGVFAINRKGSYLFKPGNIEVLVGKQIETSGLTDAEIDGLCRNVQRNVAHFVEDETLWRKAANE